MGFGTSPAGAAPAGTDLPTTTEARAARTPPALQFDGSTRDFQRDATGTGFVAQHPVDAKVFLILRTALGSIRSAVDTGQGLQNLKYIDPLKIRAQAEDYVKIALQQPIAAGEISLLSIELDTSTRGRVIERVNYTNLLTGKKVSFTP